MTARQAPRPDRSAHERAVRLPLPFVIRELSGLLGGKLVAYVARVRETRTVREWAEGVRVKRADVEPRLRMAFRIAQLIAEHDMPSVVRPWFEALNPDLDDRSPARLLREEDVDEVGPQILAAARGFVAETDPGRALREVLTEKRCEILEVAAHHGASNVRVFGSVARGDAGPTSDADFLVELEPGRSLIDQGLLVEDLQNLLGRSVHVVEPKALHRLIRDRVLKEAVLL